jgi:Tol biopolymer transport system component
MKWLLAVLSLAALAACSPAHDDPEGFRVAFENRDLGRIAVCGASGRGLAYITPDSLIASRPVTDSTRRTVYFLGRPRSFPESLTQVYAMGSDGSALRQVAELPLSPLDLQVTPDGSTLVFLGKYPDQEHVRAYQLRVGEAGFHAVTPADRSAHDPAMAPGGLNFVWHDGTRSDTLFVSSLQQFLTLPIFVFPYTQVALSWPDGRAFAAICGPQRTGLCYMLLQSEDGREVRTETVLIPEQDQGSISDPIFHPDGLRILHVQTAAGPEGRSQLQVINRNSLKITRIPTDCAHPVHPLWVR